MHKLTIIRSILLSCSILFSATYSLAALAKDEIDVENIKAPPRDVKDILQILNQTRQDQSLIDKAKKVLSKPLPSTNDSGVLNHYYYQRAVAETILENSKEALENYKKAVLDHPSIDIAMQVDERMQYAQQEALRGNLVLAKKIAEETKIMIPNNLSGWKISTGQTIVNICLRMGDFECANKALSTLENDYSDLLRVARNPNFIYRTNWQLGYERARGKVFMSEGKFLEAERSFRSALNLNKLILDNVKDRNTDALDNEVRILQDIASTPRYAYSQRVALYNELANAFLGQRRLIDAEYWARESVVLAINREGVNSASTCFALLTLSKIISEQGRQAEAVLLSQGALKVAQQSTNYSASPLIAASRKALATSLTADGKYAQADKVFNEMVDGLKADPEIALRYQTGDLDWAIALIKTGKASQAVTMTEDMLSKAASRMEKVSPRLAAIRAFYASALQVSGQSSQALSEFKQAIPILIDQARNDSENATSTIKGAQNKGCA
jgi:tetratricopeptide (TPR) repeat protein